MKICETCWHWGVEGDYSDPEDIEPALREAGFKHCPIIHEMGSRTYEKKDWETTNPLTLLALQCDICEIVFFVTGPRFGCVHWEGKNDNR